MELALEQVNAAGGFKGGKVSLIYKDDATNPDRGRQVVGELIETDGVRIIIGAVSSKVTLAIAPVCEENRVILMSPSSSAPDITEAGEYIYRNFPSDILEGTSMARFARDLGLERVVVFALSNQFGEGLTDVFTQQYESRFREVVKVFQFEESQEGGFVEMIREAKALDPDGVYIISYVQELVGLLQEMHAQDFRAVTMGSASVTADAVSMAGEAAEDLVYPQPGFDSGSTDPAVVAFVKDYTEKYGEAPDTYAAHGYDALKLLILAMEKGGGSHPEDLRMGLAHINDYKGAAGQTSFDESGDVVRYPRILIVRQGKPVPYDEFVDQGGSLSRAN
jgi:branched-chain amino acid transport system substrate-binding protein